MENNKVETKIKENGEHYKVFNRIIFCLFYILIITSIINLTFFIKSYVYPDKVPSLFGYKPLVVLSGSMKPSINIGDIVIVKETDYKKLAKNDIVTYRLNKDTLITHRINDVINNEDSVAFMTKGDSNSEIDKNIIMPNQIEGKLLFRIPLVGYVCNFSTTPLGYVVFIIIPAIILSLKDWFITLYAKMKSKNKKSLSKGANI